MSSLLAFLHIVAGELDAACGRGTARSEAIGMVITLSLAALLAVGLAAIGDGA